MNMEFPPPNFPSRDSMREDLRELHLQDDEEFMDSMVVFTRILLRRSRYSNLMGPSERGRIWKRHLLESALYSRLLSPESPVVDIGTGNGFPGVVLGMMGFGTTMLEPRRKRYLFLRHVLKELGLENCVAQCVRLEDFECGGKPVQFTARSVAPPRQLLRVIADVSGTGATLVCRQPFLRNDEEILSNIEFRTPPLDRGGFLVQYRV